MTLYREERYSGLVSRTVLKTSLYWKLYRLSLTEVIIELKAVERTLAIHEAQLVTYLKWANKKLGLLINFNVVLLKDGIKRKINGYL